MTLLDDLGERYKLAGLTSGEAIWDWDLRQDRMYVSPGFRSLLELGPTDADESPQIWFSRVHPDDLVWLDATMRPQMSEPNGPFMLEHRVRHGVDGWRWLLVRGSALIGPEETVDRLIGTVIDITRRKQAEEQLRLNEERYSLAAAATNDGLYDWDLRTDRIWFAQRWKALLGLEDTPVGDSPENWLDRVHPEDLIWLQATLDAQASAGGRPFQIEYRIRHAGGAWRWMLCRGIAVLDGVGDPVRIVGSQSDITDRKVAEEELRLSEERYALATRGANDGLWDWRIDAGAVFFSERFADMLGLAGGERTGRIEDWLNAVHAQDRPGLRAAFDRHLAGDTAHLAEEVRVHHADGTELWVLIRGVAIRDALGRAVRMAGSITDITARKRAEQQLLYDAFHDGLTGLPNRSLLQDRVGLTMDRRRRSDGQYAVILFDLDHFKTINDTLGPGVGDEVLRIVGERLAEARRAGDTVARLSADEFGVLMDNVHDVKGALSAAGRLAAVVAEPIRLPGQAPLVVTASAGIAMSNTGYGAAAEMLRDASLAMFRAKAAGRNRVEVFDEELRDRALKRLEMERDLRAAIEQEQFSLHYQPIVRLSDFSVAGFEALIRWHHPQKGPIPPAEFVPLAEETGLILPIGRWAMRRACCQVARWRQDRGQDLFISVNVSGRQFRDDDLVGLVRTALGDSGLPPNALKLEITESLLMDDVGAALMLMEAIRDQGVRLSLDDFGTGYSSLSYLHSYPITTLKIDRSFVRASQEGHRQAEITRAITLLGKALDLEMVAEGIETEAEVNFLRSLHCHYGQGYYFARPLPPEAAAVMLADGR